MRKLVWLWLLPVLLMIACAPAQAEERALVAVAAPHADLPAPHGVAPESAAPLLEYALPCGPVYYRRQKGAWFADCSATAPCTVHLELYADEAGTKLVASVRMKIAAAGLFRLTWTGKNGDRAVPEGEYYATVYATGEEGSAVRFPLTLREGKPPMPELAPTGALLPDATDDAAVWAAMMQPLVVVDIEATDHQRLYAEPSGKAEVVGSVHGQSQGLEVVAVGKTYTLVRAWRHEDGEPVEGYVPTKKLKLVTPSAHYGLLIDKRAQRMTVYEHGQPIGQIAVSTGLMSEGKLFRETRAGAFITTDRVWPFESNGYRYEYAIRIDGGNLLHQVGYTKDGSFAAQLAELGDKASEGCVRVDCRADGPDSLNAYWLWTHLEYGTKVLVLDDPDMRMGRLMEMACANE